MNSNSYPSSVSFSASPSENTDRERSTSSLSERAAPVLFNSQEDLQHATLALQAAYQRIRQVRRNLLELSETIPGHARSSRPTDGNAVGPSHRVIRLTHSFDDSDEDDFSSFIQSVRSRSPTPESLREYSSPWMGTPHQLQHHRPLQALPLSPLRPFPVRRPMEMEFTRNRPPQLDDGTTTLGRRVATTEAHNNLSSTTASRQENHSSRILAMMEHYVNRSRPSLQQRRMESARADPLTQRMWPAEAENRAIRSLDLTLATPEDRAAVRNHETRNPSAAAQNASSRSISDLERRQNGRRVNQAFSTSTQMNNSERLSTLSSISVQNLATPLSGISRPLLFEEPSSFVSSPLGQSPESSVVNSPEDVRYVIRRRFIANGEEHVHPIVLDWTDNDPPAWLLPSRQPLDDTFRDEPLIPRLPFTPSTHREDTHTQENTSAAAPTSTSVRRRAWARLDPDGNEIPLEEEEELERIRAQYRIAAQNRSRAFAPTPTEGIDVRPRLHSLRVPDSVIAASSGSGDIHSNTFFRIRLQTRNSAELSSKEISAPSFVVARDPPIKPFCADPLPMPLDQMVPSESVNRPKMPEQRARVSKFASLAGR